MMMSVGRFPSIPVRVVMIQETSVRMFRSHVLSRCSSGLCEQTHLPSLLLHLGHQYQVRSLYCLVAEGSPGLLNTQSSGLRHSDLVKEWRHLLMLDYPCCTWPINPASFLRSFT